VSRAGLAVVLVAALAAPAAAQTVAIENATVWAGPGRVIDDATVVFRGGAIVDVGKGVAVPAGATKIDGKGMVVTAGFVDASSTVGLSEIGLEATTVEGRFGDGTDIHAAYRVTDGFNPQSVAIPIARATGGLTSVVAVPRGGFVSGTSAWVQLADGAQPAVVRAPLAMYVALGEGGLAAGAGSRGLALERLRELLDDAAIYARRKGDYERNAARRFAAARLDLEALGPVVRGQLPLVVRVDRASDIRAVLELGRQLRLRLVIEGGVEAWVLARELAAARVPVIYDPTANLPDSFDHLRVRDDAARLLAAAGVTLVLSTLGESARAGTLRQLAGVAVGNGLPRDAALAAVTTAPAQAFGLTGRGELRRGAPADLVLWTGDPFELSSRPARVFIGGVDQSLRTRQTRLFERYRAIPTR
jgi:imidazolonepropionase-like amidohydrolase